jgi:hypothetical protein
MTQSHQPRPYQGDYALTRFAEQVMSKSSANNQYHQACSTYYQHSSIVMFSKPRHECESAHRQHDNEQEPVKQLVL